MAQGPKSLAQALQAPERQLLERVLAYLRLVPRQGLQQAFPACSYFLLMIAIDLQSNCENL
jgi:hypothetical protein